MPELLSAVAAGESVSIRAEDGSLFKLVILAKSPFLNPDWPGYPKAGSCEGLFVVPDDFKEPPGGMRSTETGPVPGRAKGMLTILAEDDEHLADFREYME